MSDRWPRARVAFLRTSGVVLALGVIIAIGGTVDGGPVAIPLALGGISLSLVGSFVAVDRIFHALTRNERALLLGAFGLSTMTYIVLLIVGSNQAGDTLLVIAGIPALVTGAVTMGLVAARREPPKS